MLLAIRWFLRCDFSSGMETHTPSVIQINSLLKLQKERERFVISWIDFRIALLQCIFKIHFRWSCWVSLAPSPIQIMRMWLKLNSLFELLVSTKYLWWLVRAILREVHLCGIFCRAQLMPTSHVLFVQQIQSFAVRVQQHYYMLNHAMNMEMAVFSSMI